jgi:excisionase family DNA binding protein
MNNPRGRVPEEEPDLAWVTVAEVAEVMRVSKMTVYRLIQANELRAARIGRSLRIGRADLERYLREAQARPGGSPPGPG